MRIVSSSLLVLLMTAALSGCLVDDSTSKDASASPSPSTAGASGGPSSSNNSSAPAPVAPMANLTADVLNGSAPLTVNFTIANDAADAVVSDWSLGFGDGNSTNGTSVPANASYTFTAAGSYDVVLVLDSEAGNSTANVTIIVEEGASDAPPPSETEYHSGPVVGCASDAGPDSCIVYQLGTDAEFIDGIWIQVEPGHVGMKFTSASLGGDTDGWIFADPAGDPIEAVSNSGDEAGGVVPPEAQWILIVSWMAPSDDIIVTFTPDA